MRLGLYMHGSLDASIPKFFDEHNPGIQVIQVYLNGPQRFWPASKFADQATILKIVEFMKRHDVKVVVHAPYVLTLNQPEKTAKALERHLAYCSGLGIEHLVVHSGSWKNQLLENPVDVWTQFLEPIVGKHSATVLLENMAYKDGAMTDLQLNEVCNRVKCGVCLDTAHAWVGNAPMDDLDPKHVKLIHLNQTRSSRWSGQDRHSDCHLDEGIIEPQRHLDALRKFVEADIVSEYAGDEWQREMDLLRKLHGELTR